MVNDNNPMSSFTTPNRKPTLYCTELLRHAKSQLHCTHCNRLGHDIAGCFLVRGLPEWWLDKYGSKRRSSSPVMPSSVVPTSHHLPAAVPAVSLSRALPGRGEIPRLCPAGAGTPQVVLPGRGDIPRSHPAAAATPIAAALPRLPTTTTNASSILGVFDPPTSSMASDSLSFSWIIDTGASHHVTGNDNFLQDAHSIISCPVGLPDGAKAMATKEGRVVLADGITLEHILFVPQLNCNLISVSKLIDDSNCFVRFTNSLCAIHDQSSGSLIGGGERIDGLYYFRRLPKVCALTGPDISTFELWHRRLGHPSEKIVKLIPAIRAKQTRAIFPDSDSRASRILEMIHCDLWGPYKKASTCGAHYFLTIVDDFSRGVWVYLLNDKTEVYSSFCSFFAMVKNQFDVTVKCVRSDNGTEFKHMLPYFDEHDILFQTSCVGNPQQNGRVERKHQHILNVGRALMFQGNLPIDLWAKGDKFALRSRKCVFVGYPHGKKGWKLYDFETGEIFVSRDVKFYENEFPFVSTSDSLDANVGTEGVSHDNVVVDHDFLDDLENVLEVGGSSIDPKSTHAPSTPATACDAATTTCATPHAPHTTAPSVPSTTASSSEAADPSLSSESSLDLDRCQRHRHPPSWHRDYVAHTISVSSPSIIPGSPSTPCSSGTPYPLAYFVNCDKFSVRHRVFIAAVDTMVEPRNFKEAMQDEGWKAAMQT
ncbi:uncharacterized protein LOC110684457 [Chenopodium quinoa]|uniref:uncharacterized protein LOC110684457 n=1 Tax=Chenopodium quinoa TaxID=63459 RepID=UPI000B782ED2|nr:uncharacterized protein LOC110684457 [Chenopodium quinoa]